MAMAACLVSEMVTKATSAGTSLSSKCEFVSPELQEEPNTEGATLEAGEDARSRLASSTSGPGRPLKPSRLFHQISMPHQPDPRQGGLKMIAHDATV